MEEVALSGALQGALVKPDRANGWGLVVLSGSSGRLETGRARLFAERGVTALAQRWWGGEGQSPGICEIPLETFTPAVERLLAEGCRRIAFLGVSKGAEATLLVASSDPRIDLAVAFSPSSVAWASTGPGFDGYAFFARSSWTRGGTALPFVAVDPRWRPAETGRVRFRALFEKSLATFAEDIPAATIPVEAARGRIMLVAGAGDVLWPSDTFAAQIARRLAAHGRRCDLVAHPSAGHRTILPGEAEHPEPADRAWGGSPAADRELGAAAWTRLCELMELGLP